jgi:hypothetical protein
VFDDDLDDDNVAQAKGAARGYKKKDLSIGVPGKKNNIKNMLIGMSSKNKEVCFSTYIHVLWNFKGLLLLLLIFYFIF